MRRRAPLAGITIVFAVLMMASTVSTAAPSAAARPRAGGHLVVLEVNLSWDSTDPIQPAGTSTAFNGMDLAYQNLFTFGQDGRLEPYLATGYSYNADHTVLTINLRRGVEFQDGTPFNAAAVVYNLERVSAPSSGSECVPFFTTVASISATSTYRVQITFASPYSPLPDILAAEPCTFMASPTAIQALGPVVFAEHPVGTSPWAFARQVSDAFMTFTHFKAAWQKAYLSSVTVSSVADDQSALDAVGAGTAQVFSAAGDVQDIPLARAMHGVTTEKTSDVSAVYLHLLMKTPPFDNINARRALAQAIDTPLIARQLYGGQLHWSQSLEPSTSWAFGGVRVKGYPQYNRKAAAKDVAKLPGGRLVFTLSVEDTPTEIQQAEAIQNELDAVPGVQVTLNPLQSTTFFADEHTQTYQASLAPGAASAFPDPAFLYYRNFYSASSQNQEAYSDPEFDNLAIEAQETFSVPRRKKLYLEAQQVLARDLPVVPLWTAPSVYIVNDRVHGFPAIFTSSQDISGVWES